MPWKTLMSEIFFALVTTTDHELRKPLLREPNDRTQGPTPDTPVR